jgi:hypothetical protein
LVVGYCHKWQYPNNIFKRFHFFPPWKREKVPNFPQNSKCQTQFIK